MQFFDAPLFEHIEYPAVNTSGFGCDWGRNGIAVGTAEATYVRGRISLFESVSRLHARHAAGCTPRRTTKSRNNSRFRRNKRQLYSSMRLRRDVRKILLARPSLKDELIEIDETANRSAWNDEEINGKTEQRTSRVENGETSMGNILEEVNRRNMI